MASILVVDDAAFLRVMLKDILEKAGHRIVTEATNGNDAIEKYKAYRPDIVIMDLNMPEMGGIEALEAIMRSDPKAKVIMCSALGQRHHIIAAVSCGAKDYILKPFQADRVLDAVDRVLLSTLLSGE